MKLSKATLILIFLLPFLCVGQEFKVMSYNIKYDKTSDTINNWNDRKGPMIDLFKKHSPEFIGMQEVLHNQLQFLDEALDQYSYVGVGRDDGKQKGEYSPIFYNTQDYEVVKSNTFWLSRTPEAISKGWDAALERICTYALFKNKKIQKEFWVFNTHFDHVGIKARKKSVKLIIKQIKKLNTKNLAVVLTGDLNLTPKEKPIKYLQRIMDDGLKHSPTTQNGPEGTSNGFNTNKPISKRIDYIFTKGFQVESYLHIDERLKNGKHISDHLPVLISISKK